MYPRPRPEDRDGQLRRPGQARLAIPAAGERSLAASAATRHIRPGSRPMMP